MKTLEIVIQSYNRGIMTREELVNVHGEVRRVLGVAESWLRGLRAAHYYDGADIGPVMYDIVHDFRAKHFPV